MKIAIVGYGRMGKKINEIIRDQKNGDTIVTIDKFSPDANYNALTDESLSGVDVAIDFSFPDGVLTNIETYIQHGINVVMGTTGWYDKLEDVKKMVGSKIGFIWSGNFSVGVHLFSRIVSQAAAIFNKFPDVYDEMMYEIHHKGKKDSPSGTAMMIGDLINAQLDKKNKIVTERLDRAIEPNELHVASVRGGYVPGTHVVMFDSLADTIELKHTARSRDGFAMGAVLAANWIKDKKGFYNIDDFMNDVL